MGTRMPLVSPSAIAFPAIVLMMNHAARSRRPPGHEFRQMFLQHVPVPRDTPQPDTTDAHGPPTAEWVVEEPQHAGDALTARVAVTPVAAARHSITSSARASTAGAMVKPSVLDLVGVAGTPAAASQRGALHPPHG